jgi:hypothetical protein
LIVLGRKATTSGKTVIGRVNVAMMTPNGIEASVSSAPSLP